MRKLFILLLLAFILPINNTLYGQLRLSLQAGIQVPMGDFANSATTGFGGTVTFEYWQNTPLSFTGSVGYLAWGPAGTLPANHDYKLRSIPIMIGLRYYLSRGDFHPYVGMEMGLHVLESTYSRQQSNNTIITTTENRSDFGISPMFGFRYHLGNQVDLDINLKYNLIAGTPANSFFGFNFGIQFGL